MCLLLGEPGVLDFDLDDGTSLGLGFWDWERMGGVAMLASSLLFDASLLFFVLRLLCIACMQYIYTFQNLNSYNDPRRSSMP